MSRIVELVAENLHGRPVGALADAIHEDRRRTGRVAVSALTAIFGKLRDLLKTDVAAEELHRSVTAGYDRTLLEDLPRYFARPEDASPAADDLLGRDRPGIEERLARQLAVPEGAIHHLVTRLVPVVMSALAVHASTEKLDARGLANEIVGDARELWQKEPESIDAMRRLVATDSDRIETSSAVDVGIGALG